ncbi:MAG: 50S ribosomal protein L30 [uncultured bacterium]|nr:MAG: 50S ribosomal protein L30 [uncultured bacterium]OGT46725.1 MAG: 50S ribosomal protein L30 [Gammaproteobacteria bacterium RIFCSPHIGHO2_12_FULL_41_20]
MSNKNKKQLKVTLTRSAIGCKPQHKACVATLGLRKLQQTVVIADNPCTRGMINKVGYLLSVEEV